MKKSFFIIIGLIVLAMTLPTVALTAFDANSTGLSITGGQAGFETGESNSLPILIGRVVSVVLGLLGVALVIYMIYGGFLYLTAGGTDKNIQKAKDIITNAIIGVVIIVLAYAISTFVIDQIVAATNSRNR